MVIAGAIELDQGETVLVLGLLLGFLLCLVAVCLTGGLVAWAISRRRHAFVVGSVVFASVATWLYWQVAQDVRRASLLGWIAAALSGLAIKVAGEPGRAGPRMRPGAVAIVLLVAAGGLIASTVAAERRQPPGPTLIDQTRPLAEGIGAQLGTTPSHSANEVAVAAAAAGAVVLRADELDGGGVDLVIRIRVLNEDDTQCWHFRLPRRLATPLPEPVECPEVAMVDHVSSGFAAELGGALGALSPAEKQDVPAVRSAAEEVIAAWYGPDPGWPGAALEAGMLAYVPTTLAVEHLPTGPIAVAVQVGLTNCILARLDLVNESGWITQTWHATSTQLLSPTPACHPTLATQAPPPPG